MPSLTAPPGLSLSYEPDTDILRARWLEDQDLPALQVTYLALVDATVAAGGACFWLLDMRRRAATPPEVAAWVMQMLLLKLAPTLGATPHLAYLTSPVQLDRVRELDVVPPEPSYFEANFWLGTFLNEGEALSWLAEQQQRWRGLALPASLPTPPASFRNLSGK